MPIEAFVMETCTGNWETGGWSSRVVLHDEATTSDVRDRALACLFTKDWYGGTPVSHGQVADRENILMIGWIAGETIEWDPEEGTVGFEIQGPHYWLQTMAGFPSGLESVSGAASSWIEFPTLTPKKGTWHFFHWRTTLTRILDLAVIDDSREVALFNAAPGTLWEQINNEVYAMIFSRTACDRLAYVWMGIESNLIPVGDRGFIPTIQTFSTEDLRRPISIERNTVNRASMVDLSGIFYTVSTGAAQAYFSLAPGHIPMWPGGSIERFERLALSSQGQSNTLSGLMLGWRNNLYPAVTIPLASNHRFFDITPHQYCVLPVSATDTKRGLSGSLTLIPTTVTFTYNSDTGQLLTDLECEGVTDDTGQPNLIGDAPPVPPPPGPVPPPPDPWDPVPEEDPDWPTNAYYAAEGDGWVMGGVWKTENMTPHDDATQPTWAKLATTGAWPTSHLLYSFGIDLNDPDEYVYALTGTKGSSPNIIRYSATSGTWTTILSQATVQADYGADADIYDFMIDPVTGYANALILIKASVNDYYILYRCTNPSAGVPTWASVQSGAHNIRVYGNLWVYDDQATHVFCAGGAFPNYYVDTSIAGGAWSGETQLSTLSGNQDNRHFRNRDTTDVYHTLQASSYMYRFQLGGAADSTVDVLSTAAQIAAWSRHDTVSLFMSDPSDSTVLRFLGNDGVYEGKLYTTADKFATYTDQGRLDIGLKSGPANRVVSHIAETVSEFDYDMILYGAHDAEGGNEHMIFAAYGDTDLTPVGKGGANPDTGVDSIHYGAGGPCHRGIQVYA